MRLKPSGKVESRLGGCSSFPIGSDPILATSTNYLTGMQGAGTLVPLSTHRWDVCPESHQQFGVFVQWFRIAACHAVDTGSIPVHPAIHSPECDRQTIHKFARPSACVRNVGLCRCKHGGWPKREDHRGESGFGGGEQFIQSTKEVPSANSIRRYSSQTNIAVNQPKHTVVCNGVRPTQVWEDGVRSNTQ